MRIVCIATGVAIAVAISLLVTFVYFVQLGDCSKPKHYRVSRLRGQVVGKSLGLLQYRWLRRRFVGHGARLRLSTPQYPFELIRAINADPSGFFDFGEVPPGEYGLSVYLIPGKSGFLFPFAMDPNVHNTDILIDASPAPYCSCCGWDFEPR